MDELEFTKYCARCETVRPRNDFNKRPGARDGYRSWCKTCVSLYNKEYRAKNRDVIKVKDKEYRDSNRNRERKRELGKLHYQENAEAYKERASRYRREYPERVAEWNRRAREKNWLQRRLGEVARRAAKISGSAPFHPCSDEETFWTMYESQDGLCAYCETPLFAYFHIDHMQPLCKGGEHDWMNFALTCPHCNLSKGSKTAEEFMIYLGRKRK